MNIVGHHKFITYFTIVSHKRHDFRKKWTQNVYFDFLYEVCWNISRYNKNFSYNEASKNIRLNVMSQSEPFYRDFQNRPHQFEGSEQLRKYTHSTAILGHSIIVEKFQNSWLHTSDRSRVTKWKSIKIPHLKTENIYWS